MCVLICVLSCTTCARGGSVYEPSARTLLELAQCPQARESMHISGTRMHEGIFLACFFWLSRSRPLSVHVHSKSIVHSHLHAVSICTCDCISLPTLVYNYVWMIMASLCQSFADLIYQDSWRMKTKSMCQSDESWAWLPQCVRRSHLSAGHSPRETSKTFNMMMRTQTFQ